MKSSKRIIRHKVAKRNRNVVAPALKMKIKKGDTVIVVSGKDKGKQGAVLKVLPRENRLIVEGIAKIKRHLSVKRGFTGGIIERESTIHASNVMILDPEKKVGTRVGRKAEGKKTVRVATKSGKTLK